MSELDALLGGAQDVLGLGTQGLGLVAALQALQNNINFRQDPSVAALRNFSAAQLGQTSAGQGPVGGFNDLFQQQATQMLANNPANAALSNLGDLRNFQAPGVPDANALLNGLAGGGQAGGAIGGAGIGGIGVSGDVSLQNFDQPVLNPGTQFDAQTNPFGFGFSQPAPPGSQFGEGILQIFQNLRDGVSNDNTQTTTTTDTQNPPMSGDGTVDIWGDLDAQNPFFQQLLEVFQNWMSQQQGAGDVPTLENKGAGNIADVFNPTRRGGGDAPVMRGAGTGEAVSPRGGGGSILVDGQTYSRSGASGGQPIGSGNIADVFNGGGGSIPTGGIMGDPRLADQLQGGQAASPRAMLGNAIQVEQPEFRTAPQGTGFGYSGFNPTRRGGGDAPVMRGAGTGEAVSPRGGGVSGGLPGFPGLEQLPSHQRTGGITGDPNLANQLQGGQPSGDAFDVNVDGQIYSRSGNQPVGGGQPAGGGNFLNQSLQGLSSLASSGGPITEQIQNIQRQQSRDTQDVRAQNAIRGLREQQGATGFTNSGLTDFSSLMAKMGAANNVTASDNQIALGAANTNFGAQMAANNALNQGALGAGNFGLNFSRLNNDIFQQNRNFGHQLALDEFGLGIAGQNQQMGILGALGDNTFRTQDLQRTQFNDFRDLLFGSFGQQAAGQPGGTTVNVGQGGNF